MAVPLKCSKYCSDLPVHTDMIRIAGTFQFCQIVFAYSSFSNRENFSDILVHFNFVHVTAIKYTSISKPATQREFR